jgi:hypothetical protein
VAVLDRAVVVGVGSGAVADGPAAKIVALELWRRASPVEDGLELSGQTTFTSSRRCFEPAPRSTATSGRAPGEKDSDSRLSTRTFLPV